MSNLQQRRKLRKIKTATMSRQLTRLWRVHRGDCRKLLRRWYKRQRMVEVVICDPPYHLTSITQRFGKTKLSDKTKTSQRGRDRSDGYARLARGFMNTSWDGSMISFDWRTWRRIYRVMKPGAYLVAFGGTRTSHRIACAIEDAGFILRDTFMWLHGQGFPKSRNVGRDLDRLLGKKRPAKGMQRASGYAKLHVIHGVQKERLRHPKTVDVPLTKLAKMWHGYGTAVKPAWEPIIIAQKPIDSTSIAQNIIAHGAGGINIDATRIGHSGAPADAKNLVRKLNRGQRVNGKGWGMNRPGATTVELLNPSGRWPANIIHDGSPEVLMLFPHKKPGIAVNKNRDKGYSGNRVYGKFNVNHATPLAGYLDGGGSVARFFYTAKAAKRERIFYCSICHKAFGHNKIARHQHRQTNAKGKPDFSHIMSHPTVKPLALMKYLVTLFTPPNGRVLDPFCGSGTTLQAAAELGFQCVGIEQDKQYIKHIRRRMRNAGF